jgi:hypothetical protein
MEYAIGKHAFGAARRAFTFGSGGAYSLLSPSSLIEINELDLPLSIPEGRAIDVGGGERRTGRCGEWHVTPPANPEGPGSDGIALSFVSSSAERHSKTEETMGEVGVPRSPNNSGMDVSLWALRKGKRGDTQTLFRSEFIFQQNNGHSQKLFPLKNLFQVNSFTN